MTITWTTFAIRLLVGFFLAVGIGIERQWLKTRAVLKTNVLVTLGSAMFVMLSIMTPGDASPTRISAQIVSGVGFLGGGVILREGASVRGINTAATLWCAAAIGTLVGSGFLVQAYLSTLAVVGANLLLRPLVQAFKQKKNGDDLLPVNNLLQTETKVLPTVHQKLTSAIESPSIEGNYQYICRLVCPAKAEAKVFDLLSQLALKKQLITVEMQSVNFKNEAEEIETEIRIRFQTQTTLNLWQDSREITEQLKADAEVSSISWQIV